MTNYSPNQMPWIEKYRPRKLDDISQDNNLLEVFSNGVKTGRIPHFLFYGPPGTGKTSAILAIGREIFKEHFLTRVIEFNASDDRGINAVREKITREAKKYVTQMRSEDGSIIPPYKIIILDEADSMTDEAQDALRVIIETYSGVTIFCFICNYITKITDAIKSRCAVVHFKKLNHICMINKLKEISKSENMELKKNILNTIIKVSNGDMRKAIMLLQNLKYLYDFKMMTTKPIFEMSNSDLKVVSKMNFKVITNTDINESDIYRISSVIPTEQANKIITDAISCKNINDIMRLSKEIISCGYPIDNILVQLNKAVLGSTDLTDEEKSRIIVYSGKILYRIKEWSNEYIQLLDYLSNVHGVKHNNPVYEFIH